MTAPPSELLDSVWLHLWMVPEEKGWKFFDVHYKFSQSQKYIGLFSMLSSFRNSYAQRHLFHNLKKFLKFKISRLNFLTFSLVISGEEDIIAPITQTYKVAMLIPKLNYPA